MSEKIHQSNIKKTGIFMPARLNSERLPNKLILPISTTCLFDIACDKLNQVDENINKYVLINDVELIDIAKKYKNIKIIIRDEATCNAETPLKYIFKDILNVEDNYLMFLNPCLLMLKKETIENSVNIFNNSDKEYATSVKEFKNWILTKDGEMLNDINYEELTTKEINPIFETAHCFHIFNKHKFIENGKMLDDNFLPIEISKEETVDVDTHLDFMYASFIYKQNQNRILR